MQERNQITFHMTLSSFLFLENTVTLTIHLRSNVLIPSVTVYCGLLDTNHWGDVSWLQGAHSLGGKADTYPDTSCHQMVSFEQDVS